MIEQYTYPIVALLPITAVMLVLQTNPYHALVMRAILGAIAALVYVVLGGADVALTEALVGTMLAVTLYVIAVRSSLMLRLGILTEHRANEGLQELLTALGKTVAQHYLRLELSEFGDVDALDTALAEGKIHGLCRVQPSVTSAEAPLYQTIVRVPRLMEILQCPLISAQTDLALANPQFQENKP